MRILGVPSLRSQQCITVMRAAFRAGKERFGFRLVHYAVQPNHLHDREAKNKRALSSSARGLAIRIAMRLNHLLGRKGRSSPSGITRCRLGRRGRFDGRSRTFCFRSAGTPWAGSAR